jgi:hypothetical protein
MPNNNPLYTVTTIKNQYIIVKHFKFQIQYLDRAFKIPELHIQNVSVSQLDPKMDVCHSKQDSLANVLPKI